MDRQVVSAEGIEVTLSFVIMGVLGPGSSHMKLGLGPGEPLRVVSPTVFCL